MTICIRESIAETLKEFLEKLPDTPDPSVEGAYVPKFITNLARKWPSPINLQDEKGLEALSRKVDIAKKVWTAYDKEWEKPIIRDPLTPPFFCY